MIGLLKYLKGYVRIKVWGFSPERFMNLCSNRNILLWDIIREDDVYYMCVSLSGFYQLRPIVRKTGTRVAILKRYGLPFFVPVILARKIFVIGLFLCVAFWIVSSYFIWDIELTGNYQITDDVFTAFLKENQVKIGMKKKDLDIETLEKEIRRTFPEITWTSAKLDGTMLNIEIKENDAPIVTAVKEEEGGKDLVAEYDGTVISMIVRSGVPKVSIGDTVEKGTVMVEGKVPVYNEDATVREYQYVSSDADIVLQHEIKYEEKLPFDYIQKEYTGRTKTRYFLRFGDKELKITQDQPYLVYDCVIKEHKPLVFEKLSIPVFWGTYLYREYLNVEYEYTADQAGELLVEKMKLYLDQLQEKGVKVIDKNAAVSVNGSAWVINGAVTVQEECGRSVDTQVEDTTPAGTEAPVSE